MKPKPPEPTPLATPEERQQDRKHALLHEALCKRCLAIEVDCLDLMDLLSEAHRVSLWTQMGYPSAARYFEEGVGLHYRTVQRLVAIGRGLERLPDSERVEARKAIARLGTHKAGVLAPLLGAEDQDWRALVTQAGQMTEQALQERVSKVTEAAPRSQ